MVLRIHGKLHGVCNTTYCCFRGTKRPGSVLRRYPIFDQRKLFGIEAADLVACMLVEPQRAVAPFVYPIWKCIRVWRSAATVDLGRCYCCHKSGYIIHARIISEKCARSMISHPHISIIVKFLSYRCAKIRREVYYADDFVSFNIILEELSFLLLESKERNPHVTSLLINYQSARSNEIRTNA